MHGAIRKMRRVGFFLTFHSDYWKDFCILAAAWMAADSGWRLGRCLQAGKTHGAIRRISAVAFLHVDIITRLRGTPQQVELRLFKLPGRERMKDDVDTTYDDFAEYEKQGIFADFALGVR
jgi:hypothetical protein